MQPYLKAWSCGAGQLVATLFAMWMIVEPTTASQRAPSDAFRPSEVIVIGMIHAPAAFLLESSYSPAHVRATLTRFRPAMIGTEASPLWNAWGMSLTATWEIDHLVVPWAAAAGASVHGIDWVTDEDLALRARRRLANARDAMGRPPRSLAEVRRQTKDLAANIQSQLVDTFADPEQRHVHEWFWWINSGARSKAPAVREFWDGNGRSDPGGPEAGARAVALLAARHDGVTQHIVTLLRRRPGARLAVLIGYSHKPDLDRRLGRLPNVRVIQLGDLTPLTPADVQRGWRPEDAVATLRESLDGDAYYFNPELVNQALVSRTLETLRRGRVRTREVQYYEARLWAVRGRTQDAMRMLAALINSGASERNEGPNRDEGVLSLIQRARLELGRLHDQRGDRAAAVREYERIRSELDQIRPVAPADDGFSTAAGWATEGFAVADRLAMYAATRERVEMLLREPWSADGSGSWPPSHALEPLARD